MKKQVTAIFDIGKTNKKFFLFDRNFRVLYREHTTLQEKTDEDGYPAEDLQALQHWMFEVLERLSKNTDYNIVALNFSAYGASLVYIDQEGTPVAPLYNYTRPLHKTVSIAFYEAYGPKLKFAASTGSPASGMLNSGMQLYWIKHSKPEIFKNILFALHLPQYASYLFSGIPRSEYTSIGCHTALWDYETRAYHHWVSTEGLEQLLAPIVPTTTFYKGDFLGKALKIGVGIHDSSASLLPYLKAAETPFVLLSTGTWSVALNPNAKGSLTEQDLKDNCLYYMLPDGKPVRASRLFLGWEYEQQLKRIEGFFGLLPDSQKDLTFSSGLYAALLREYKPQFQPDGLPKGKQITLSGLPCTSFEAAYHQLMLELVYWQVKSIRTALGGEIVPMLFVDGGFSDNEVFIRILSHQLIPMKVRTAEASPGAALGAAMVLSSQAIPPEVFDTKYPLKKKQSRGG